MSYMSYQPFCGITKHSDVPHIHLKYIVLTLWIRISGDTLDLMDILVVWIYGCLKTGFMQVDTVRSARRKSSSQNKSKIIIF